MAGRPLRGRGRPGSGYTIWIEDREVIELAILRVGHGPPSEWNSGVMVGHGPLYETGSANASAQRKGRIGLERSRNHLPSRCRAGIARRLWLYGPYNTQSPGAPSEANINCADQSQSCSNRDETKPIVRRAGPTAFSSNPTPLVGRDETNCHEVALHPHWMKSGRRRVRIKDARRIDASGRHCVFRGNQFGPGILRRALSHSGGVRG